MTVGELAHALAELVRADESAADREVLVRVGVGRYESIPLGNVERWTVAMRPAVVIDLLGGQ